MASTPPLIMKLAMTVSPYPTFPRTREKGQSNRYAKFYDYESAEEYINTLMGRIKVGWNRVV